MLATYFTIASVSVASAGLIINLMIRLRKYNFLKISYDKTQEKLTQLTEDAIRFKDNLNKIKSDASIFEHQHKHAQNQLRLLLQELNQSKQKSDTLGERLHSQHNKNITQGALIQSLKKENDQLKIILSEKKMGYQLLQQKSEKEKIKLQQHSFAQQLELSKLKNYIEETRTSTKEKLALLENAKFILSQQFENIANKIFEEKNEKFSRQNKFDLSEVLQPFSKEMGTFKKMVDDLYTKESKERALLQTEVNKLFELNQTMSKEAQNLTKALKGDKKLQGIWGEIILERVLEYSGLRKGHEYDTQASLKKDYDNQSLRPDVVVHLPGKKDVVIDAKVSLVSYEAYVRTEDKAQEKLYLKQHNDAIRQHVVRLSKKKYETLSGINSLDFILMFMPIESAFIVAFQHDNNLLQYAFRQNIIIVAPTTLIATLRIIRNTWKHDKLCKNTSEISRCAANMLDKFRGFTEDIGNLGRYIDNTKKSYNQVLNKLTTGKGNLIRQSSQLKALGVTMRKDIPQYISDQVDI